MAPVSPKVILLGGHDLEMTTIKNLLEERGVTFHDRELGWENACLSAYADVLNDDLHFVGIELKKDIELPTNYQHIDHHNENADKPSSLEQVAALLGIELTREQQLIAANDKGHIPAMKAIGATKEEIAEIRRLDRLAQGVTKEDERLGKKSIKKNLKVKDGITRVKALTPKFSAITDRLYPNNKLLIYTETELNYFGEGAKLLSTEFDALIKEGKAYFGGTGDGFFGLTDKGIDALGGIKAARKKALEILISETSAMNPEREQQTSTLPDDRPLYSYHIFIFPFKWDNTKTVGKSFSERFDLTKIKAKDDTSWVNLPNPLTAEYATELYNEKNFFYEFVHPVLYDYGERKDPVVLHYERKEAYENQKLTYEIDVIANPSKLYRLNLKSIGLNLYSTGTGSLVFYIENRDYKDLDDVLRINQFGRRILPPFMDKVTGVLGAKYAELANHIALTGLKGGEHRYFEDYSNYTDKTSGNPARFIESLIDDFCEDLKIKPVTDDRMYVLCWYGNDKMSEQVKGKWIKKEGFKNDWYRFLFVDGGDSPMCSNEKMKNLFLKSHTYQRWQGEGALHGISRYSFVYLTKLEPYDFLKTHFRTIYARMVELSLIQRATILKFSDEVALLSKLKNERTKDLTAQISELYKAYIRFVNQIYFREVTAQEQGIELYNLLQDKMKIVEQVKDLDKEIEELHNYANLREQKEQDGRIAKITVLGAIFLPATFLVGLFGSNTMPDTEKLPNKLLNGEAYAPFWISVGFIVLLSLISIILVDLIGRFGILFKQKKKS
jgi:hypothetical protein